MKELLENPGSSSFLNPLFETNGKEVKVPLCDRGRKGHTLDGLASFNRGRGVEDRGIGCLLSHWNNPI